MKSRLEEDFEENELVYMSVTYYFKVSQKEDLAHIDFDKGKTIYQLPMSQSNTLISADEFQSIFYSLIQSWQTKNR